MPVSDRKISLTNGLVQDPPRPSRDSSPGGTWPISRASNARNYWLYLSLSFHDFFPLHRRSKYVAVAFFIEYGKLTRTINRLNPTRAIPLLPRPPSKRGKISRSASRSLSCPPRANKFAPADPVRARWNLPWGGGEGVIYFRPSAPKAIASFIYGDHKRVKISN